MASSPDNQARVRELTQRVADDLADEAAIAELDALLRDDPAARRAYLRMIDLHFDLERKAARGTLDAGSVDAAVIEFPAQRPRFSKVRTLAAAAAVMLAAIGAWWIARPAENVATIIKGSGEVWQGRDPSDRIVRRGQDLKLASGLVEIETSTGVRMVWEGPCHARFAGAQNVNLLAGKLYAEVPESAHGFTVNTAAGEIVDMGTRFAIDASVGKPVADVQVYEGRVLAKFANAGASRGAHVTAGEAVRMEATAHTIEPAAFADDRFTQIVGPFYEPFQAEGRDRRIAGHRGWIEASTGSASQAHIRPRGMSYPGLAPAMADALEIWPKAQSFSPPGHRWPFPFASAILQLDDDLVKQLRHRPDIRHVTLLSIGSPSPSDPESLRLVVQTDLNAGSSHCRLGLAAGSEAAYSTDSYHHTQVFFTVLKVEHGIAQLWINPAPEAFGLNSPPPPDVTLALPDHAPAGCLWIGETKPQSYTYWWLDELRGGRSWAEVTPPID